MGELTLCDSQGEEDIIRLITGRDRPQPEGEARP